MNIFHHLNKHNKLNNNDCKNLQHISIKSHNSRRVKIKVTTTGRNKNTYHWENNSTNVLSFTRATIKHYIPTSEIETQLTLQLPEVQRIKHGVACHAETC